MKTKATKTKEIHLSNKRTNILLRIYLVILAALIILVYGCGYHISSSGSDISDKTIVLDVFENHTHPYQPGIEVYLYQALSDELMLSSFDLSQNKYTADYVITGNIIEYKQTVLSNAPDQTPTEIKVGVKIKIFVVEKGGRKNNYIVSPKPEPFAVVQGETLEEAGRRALRNAARQILSKITGEDFK